VNSESVVVGREFVASVCLSACVALAARCQEPTAADAAASAQKSEKAWMKVFSKHAEDYKIYPAGKSDKPFRFVAQPVFRHDAPSRNSDDIGGVWVWTDEDGRPVVIGTVFGWSAGDGSRSVLHEFHTLSTEPIEAVWRNRDRWVPEEGVSFKPVPDAPAPDASASKRRLQMRQIARRFSAYTVDNGDRRWQLRLVPAPVYQWDAGESSERLGGAIFVICQDTNTDVVICIEARATPDGPKFFYACGSFADWEAHAELDGKEVWFAARGEAASRSAKSPHWVRFVPSERL
jgi:hypothetical protein